jgi:hypothetical protein
MTRADHMSVAPASLGTISQTAVGMRKSFSIDSSLSMVSHHAAARTHPDRPADHGGHGMRLTGLKTLNEDKCALKVTEPVIRPQVPIMHLEHAGKGVLRI